MTTSKFAGLLDGVAETARIEINHPATGKPLVGKDGQPAWIEVWSSDSPQGQAFDRAERKKIAEAAQKGQADDMPDPFDVTVAKCARLTRAWHLVDLKGEVIDVPCTPENALELYSAANPVSASIYRQVAVGVGSAANFIKPSPDSSSPSPSRSSEAPAA